MIGFALALGGGKVYEAETLIQMGQPFSPNGGAPVASFITNGRAVAEIIRSEAALEKAARASGLKVRALRGNVTLPDRRCERPRRSADRSAAGDDQGRGRAATQGGEGGRRPRRGGRSARTAAEYVDTKIKAFNDQLESIQEQLNTLVPRIALLEQAVTDDELAALDKLVLVSSLDNAQARRGQLLDLQSDVQQQLALAENVEKTQVIEPAAAVKTTARSGRNGALVGGLIGLLLGCAAALLADPFLTRRARTS